MDPTFSPKFPRSVIDLPSFLSIVDSNAVDLRLPVNEGRWFRQNASQSLGRRDESHLHSSGQAPTLPRWALGHVLGTRLVWSTPRAKSLYPSTAHMHLYLVGPDGVKP
jgi:hypothetical protein